jgi:opacity protein-like surface antigen
LADRWRGRALLAVLLVCALPAPAAADWYFTPFIGWDFHGTTTLIDFDYRGANRTKATFGGSVALLGDLVGVEGDYAFVPSFFRNPEAPLGSVIANSHVQTVTGNFMLAAPLSLTRESLRPYVLAGLGWMDAYSEDLIEDSVVDDNLVGMALGVGAIGMFGERVGLRFDLRRFWNLDRERSDNAIGETRLSFWRATVGVTLRY